MLSKKLIVMSNTNGWGPCPIGSNDLVQIELNSELTNLSDEIDSRVTDDTNNIVDSDAEIYRQWMSNCVYDVYRKSERSDKICDWLMSADRRAMSGQGSGPGGISQRIGGGIGSGQAAGGVQNQTQPNQLNSLANGEDDDSGFSFYDTSKLPKSNYSRRGGRYNASGFRGRYGNNRMQQQHLQSAIGASQSQVSGSGGSQAVLGQLKATKSLKNLERERERQIMKLKKQYGNRQEQKTQQNRVRREPSIRIRSEWCIVDEVNFSQLTKLTMAAPNAETLFSIGNLGYYDKSYDNVSTKSEKRLIMSHRIVNDISTMDDPIIREVCRTGGKFSQKTNENDLTTADGEVYITDTILATLMCCSRSVYPWDIIVTKIQNKLFFDKRANFEELTVSETSNDPPNDDDYSVNSPKNLSNEAMLINANFGYQVLKRYTAENSTNSQCTRHRLSDRNNPFVENANEAVGYRYNQFNLKNGMNLIVRCRLDAVIDSSTTLLKSDSQNSQLDYINIYALNEWDSKYSNGIDWRSKLDTQRGAVLAAELKNNNFKLAKWTAASILVGADQMKFGFVSRIHPKDPTRHVIRGVHTFSPSEFGKQMNLNMDNAWGIVRWVVDFLSQQTDGKYVIVKDPIKPTIRIYKIPQESPNAGGIDAEQNEFELGDLEATGDGDSPTAVINEQLIK
ncbi:hypothetical protein GJ496_004975 [Pomphorhynchus laevis]|nr:hypothetical protein GJ496_004975 [Pomphorhynchus laevis]